MYHNIIMPRERSEYQSSYYQRNKAKFKEYYLNNREKIINTAKKYYRDNITFYKDYFHLYYLENRDFLLAKQNLRNDEYYEKNQEVLLEKMRNYYKLNINRFKELSKRYRILRREMKKISKIDSYKPNPSLVIDFD